MGDSTAMTIEFLRARLLSERSVSRSAKQRANQLAKRVVELEEQLRIVTIQRKKAEKAAAEVLAILETRGIGDFSEVIDSSSDRDEVPGGLKGSDDNAKEDETSTTSRMDRSEVEDGLSGSELEVAPTPGRSLSWKSRSNSPDSLEKKKVNQARQRQRQNSFVSTVGSSPKHHLGKSCRKIKRRETGPVAERGKVGATEADDVSNYLDNASQISRTVRGNEEEKLEDPVSCSLEDKSREANGDLYANGSDRDEEMERALQQQAQLIGQYQDEENAQREWEEKYNENNNSTFDSCEPGKQPDTAEDRNLVEEASRLVDESLCPDKEADSRTENICDSEDLSTRRSHNVGSPNNQTVNGGSPQQRSRYKIAAATNFSTDPIPAEMHTCSVPTLSVDTDGYTGQQCNRRVANESETGFQGFEFPGPPYSRTETNKKQDQGLIEGIISEGTSHSNTSLQPHVHGVHESTSTESLSSARTSDKFTKGQWSDIQIHLHGALPEAPNSSLGSVLESLQRAKLSLRRQLNRSQQPQLPPSQEAWATKPPHPVPGQGAWATMPSSPMSSQGAWATMPSSPMPSQGAWATMPSSLLPNQGAWTTATDSQALTVRASDTMDIPLGAAGLFRLPTDISPQTDISRPSYYYSSGLSLATHPSYYSSGLSLAPHRSGARFAFAGAAPSDQHYPSNLEPGSGVPATRMPLPAFTSRYTYPTSDLTGAAARTTTPSYDGFQNPYTDMKGGMAAGDRDPYSVYGVDRTRPRGGV